MTADVNSLGRSWVQKILWVGLTALAAVVAAAACFVLWVVQCVLGDGGEGGPVPGSLQDQVCQADPGGLGVTVVLGAGALAALVVCVVMIRRDLALRTRVLLVALPVIVLMVPPLVVTALPG